MRVIRGITHAALAAAVTLPLGAAAAHADDVPGYPGMEEYTAVLEPVTVNRSQASGTATIWLDGLTARVRITVDDVLVDHPHAQHIHIGGRGECPTDYDAGIHNGKRALSTLDGVDAYGGVETSITTEGDTSAASALAVDRFPTAPDGMIDYDRTFELSQAAADAVRAGNAVVVIHGIDYDGDGTYGDVLGASDLDPNLPMEATNPTACGPLR
ncbi:CHRD domain-containing protein [Nocardiopsis sp. CC223A]|uniref:CHRD domain-containing protein n=1 Tax=Nocardiopsis sp. CC223A TaxID=3044051 RepID=UPI00278BB064|nr:CHRD domain-containing protein [Nocardiopsis sp. CC223A]